MTKKTKVVLIIIILVVVVFLAYYFLINQPLCWPYCPGMTDQDRARIKEEMREAGCPDEMIVDKMPGPNDQSNKTYYIKDSKRVEITEYDPIWVNANCEVPVTEVQ